MALVGKRQIGQKRCDEHLVKSAEEMVDDGRGRARTGLAEKR